MTRSEWEFSQYVEEIVAIAELREVPGFGERLEQTIAECWERYPAECEELGMRQPVSRD